MLHGSQEFVWGEPVCVNDQITTTTTCKEIYEKDGMGFYVFESVSTNQDGAEAVRGHLDQHRQGGLTMAELEAGDPIPELKVTPDKYLPHRYAGASGDFNPIHIDKEFATQVGLPSNILHGLYMMALVARGNAALADGDPRALKRLSVQFRGMGFPEQELVVSGTIKSVDDGRVVVDTVAEQAGDQVIRNAQAELELP